MSKPRFRKVQCRICGKWITSNALGRASHQRGADCVSRFALADKMRLAPRVAK